MVLSLFKSLTSKIIYKIGVLATIIIVFIISSFAILAYFQSQQTLLGNSINIAGKNRFLTMNVLFQTSEYLNGVFSSSSSSSSSQPSSSTYNSIISKLNDAINKLDTNLLVLREGGKTSNNIELKPLPSNFIDSWKIINNDWSRLKTFITYKVVTPAQLQQQQALLQKQQQEEHQALVKTTTTTTTATIPRNVTRTTAFSAAEKIYQSTKTELESLAAKLINSSDMLVTQLGVDSAKNSLNVMLLEISFGIMNIGVILLILYFVKKVLKPISALTQATSEIKKGNLDVPIQEHKGNDELSVLGESFNSMVQSIKNYTTNQNQLTSELKKLNEQLKYKDQLKDQFIGIAAHELRTPIQPILGLTEVIRSRKAASTNIDKEDDDDDELLNVIVRNAKRLRCLSENILDVSKIESQTLKLNKEKFNINENIRNVINDTKSKEGSRIEITFAEPKVDPIVVEADKIRIYEVISNLFSNAIKFTKKSSSNNRTDASTDNDNNGGSNITVFTTIKSNQTYNKVNTTSSSSKGGDEVVISIKDRGTGIDPSIHDKLFSIFVTKSDTGSGLGLFISKGIVEAHGGRIWAQNNNDGKGATFSFSLPLSKQIDQR
jgi:signal transduction histidine kinase